MKSIIPSFTMSERCENASKIALATAGLTPERWGKEVGQ